MGSFVPRVSSSLLSLYCLQLLSVCARVLVPRESAIPAPIKFNPDQNWDGIDGSWSSFTLRVGTPPQTVRVLPSWTSYQTLVIASQGCIYATDLSACSSARGGLFNYSQSSTFDEIGIFATSIEQNLGFIGNAEYGWDIVSLGGVGEGGPTLKNTTVGAVAVDAFYLGIFGLNPKPTNWTSYENSSPSYMTQLKEQGLIPSVSFGYTAGAPYRFTGVLGSLTMGGYDSSRFNQTSSLEFGFASNNERDTVVAIQSISTPSQQNSATQTELLPEPIYALIDATVSQIWLPIEACQKFEDEFGLVYDNNTDLYLVNSTLHAKLLQRKAQITFTLAQGASGGPTTTITLPYSAFDLTASQGYQVSGYQQLANSTAYFPLRRAQNDTQYTLGRAFMQEAYVTVDYERSKFNVSQCTWVQDAASSIVPISAAAASENSQYSGAGTNATNSTNSTSSTDSTGSKDSKSSSSLSGGAIGGIVVAVCVLVLAGIIVWYFRRRYRNKLAAIVKETPASSPSRESTDSTSRTVLNEAGTKVFPKAELEGSNMQINTSMSHLPGTPTAVESPTTEYGTHMSGSTQITSVVSPISPGGYTEAGGEQLFEMPGDMPVVSQADGRQITEKDIMKRREEAINGLDPHASQETQVATPTTAEQLQPPPPPRRTVQPGDVLLKDVVRDGSQPNIHSNHSRFSFEDDDETPTIGRRTAP